MSNLRSIQFVSFRFDLFRFVSFCFVSFRFVSFRFDLFRFVSICFVSFRSVSFRSVSFLFRFALYRDPRLLVGTPPDGRSIARLLWRMSLYILVYCLYVYMFITIYVCVMIFMTSPLGCWSSVFIRRIIYDFF